MYLIKYYEQRRPDRIHQWYDSGHATEDDAWDAIAQLFASADVNPAEYVFFPVVDWERRESSRFDDGTYKRPVWARDRFFLDYDIGQHYVHVSTEDPTMIAFTEDAAKGAADRQTRMKPGKYLTKFFGASEKTGYIAAGPYEGDRPKLSKQQIAYYAEWFAKGERPKLFEDLELKFATTPLDIARAYKEGVRSCMGGSEGGRSFKTIKDHPTRVYGAGDLHLAYFEDKEGRIRARAICWPEKKTFGRCYPAPQNWTSDGFGSEAEAQECQDELRQRLRDMGYTDIGERSSALEGARLLRIPVKDTAGFFVMPYLDNEYGIVEAEGEDKDKFFIMKRYGQTEGVIRCGSTEGRVYVPTLFTCACCGQKKEAGDYAGRNHQHEVFTTWDDGPANPEIWCSSCIRHSTYLCVGTSKRFSMRGVPATYFDGAHYAKPFAEKQGIFTCAYDGRAYMPRERGPRKVVVGGKTYCDRNLQYVAFHCLHDGKDYAFSEMSTKHPGFPKSMDKDDIPQDVRDKFNIMRRRLTYDLRAFSWVDETKYPYSQNNAAHFWAERHTRNEARRLARQRAAQATLSDDQLVAELIELTATTTTITPVVRFAAE